MRYHFFTIEALQPATGEEALNAFCAGHRVVSVDRHFVDQGASSYWSLCVATVDGADPARSAPPSQGLADHLPARSLPSPLVGEGSGERGNPTIADQHHDAPGALTCQGLVATSARGPLPNPSPARGEGLCQLDATGAGGRK
ncbi:MAG: hypothetical protein DVS81_13595 [Candidatus Accumulibacter meliphilus]|uniref:Uncharacterized protein n=1 Tax=Candidatus Accumulibacter meliphilus TaxID=2211374 RepID=A0A369XRH1_9PROT|nr:MAG: hypothetical protein DVS81_13595 [Candidatus Accumulibacter meliphilus]